MKRGVLVFAALIFTLSFLSVSTATAATPFAHATISIRSAQGTHQATVKGHVLVTAQIHWAGAAKEVRSGFWTLADATHMIRDTWRNCGGLVVCGNRPLIFHYNPGVLTNWDSTTIPNGTYRLCFIGQVSHFHQSDTQAVIVCRSIRVQN